MINTIIKIIFTAVSIFFLSSCSKKNFSNLDTYHFKSSDGKPNYGDIHYWASHPYKWDPADSIPKPLITKQISDSSVDVFFIHPTTLTSNTDTRWNASIDDSEINTKTDYSPILYQASSFNNGTRVFAPRYRQAHLRAFFSDDKINNFHAFELAYTDVKSAFEYYIEHYNNGRPIIIASHSQGTIYAERILLEYFDGKKLQEKLVCAYLIGMPIPVSYFKILKPCKDSLETGCFTGWRTYKTGYIDSIYIAKETEKSFVTNPLSWKNDDEFIDKRFNEGGVLINFNKIKKGITDAQIHDNILWSSRPKFFGSFLIRNKNYHIGDINLFYVNIRNNVQSRIKMYKKLAH